MSTFLYYILFLVLTTHFIQPKVVHKTITFKKGNEWQYITKFGISIGQGLFEVKARFKRPYIPEGAQGPTNNLHGLDINFYLDTKWDGAMEEPDCYLKKEHEIRVEKLILKEDGDWSDSRYGGASVQSYSGSYS